MPVVKISRWLFKIYLDLLHMLLWITVNWFPFLPVCKFSKSGDLHLQRMHIQNYYLSQTVAIDRQLEGSHRSYKLLIFTISRLYNGNKYWYNYYVQILLLLLFYVLDFILKIFFFKASTQPNILVQIQEWEDQTNL